LHLKNFPTSFKKPILNNLIGEVALQEAFHGKLSFKRDNQRQTFSPSAPTFFARNRDSALSAPQERSKRLPSILAIKD
jgi:hypothetical protein